VTSEVFAEGTDFAPVADPLLAAHPGSYDGYHAPPTVTLPAGTQLAAGRRVALDHYTVVPIAGWQVGACLTEPAVQQWVSANAAKLDGLFPANAGLFLAYDEMRHMNSCAACRAKSLTAGQLLAWNVQQTVQTLEAVRAGRQYYFWSDMFDPNHNAHDDYYFVEGDIAGSWQGLPADAIIMNWNLGGLAASFGWFAGKDPRQTLQYRQIIAGYYDSGDGYQSAKDELGKVAGLPGLIGTMYTSWVDDYSQLEPYARGAREAWVAYKATLP